MLYHFYDNYGEYRSILVIHLLMHSAGNCRGS